MFFSSISRLLVVVVVVEVPRETIIYSSGIGRLSPNGLFSSSLGFINDCNLEIIQ